MTSQQDERIEDLLTDSEDELPIGWEMKATDDGRVFFVNHAQRHTQWKHPKSGKEKYLSAELPFGWERGEDAEGKQIFLDRVNKRSTCVDPRLVHAATKKQKNKFDSSSSALAVIRGRDMRGKTALITGANSGIGFETAMTLSLHGCHVVMACRDTKRGKDAADKILLKQVMKVPIDVMECDLSSLKSVRCCAEEFKQTKLRLDILICNAAVLGLPYDVTEDGIEQTFAINHLSHFYLVDLLKESLIETHASRVVVVSSESHRFPSLYGNVFDLESVPLRKNEYWPIVAYNQSKLCNVLFALELNRRLSPYGVCCNVVNPGCLVYTRLHRNSWWYKALYLACRPFTKSQAQAASTTIFCATSSELEGVGGCYFSNCCSTEPSSIATNEIVAKKLWEYSEKLAYKKLNPDGSIRGKVIESFSRIT